MNTVTASSASGTSTYTPPNPPKSPLPLTPLPPSISPSFFSTVTSFASSGINILITPVKFAGSLVYAIYDYAMSFFFTRTAPSSKTNNPYDIAKPSKPPVPAQPPIPPPPQILPKFWDGKKNRKEASELRGSLKIVFEETSRYLAKAMASNNYLRSRLLHMKEYTKTYAEISYANGSGVAESSLAGAWSAEEKERFLSTLPTYTHTDTEVINADTIDAALKLKKEGLNPLVLSMANKARPGGDVESGSSTQEEEICRKTALFFSLSPKHNPAIPDPYTIPEYGCIYSPEVPVLRKKESDHYSWLPNLGEERLSFVSSAAYDLNTNHNSSDLKLTTAAKKQGMRAKIRTQIFCAFLHGHDSLVLSAFGCGAFKNNPKKVAKYYAEELAPYKKYFKKIAFVIYTSNPNDKNLKAFREKFTSAH